MFNFWWLITLFQQCKVSSSLPFHHNGQDWILTQKFHKPWNLSKSLSKSKSIAAIKPCPQYKKHQTHKLRLSKSIAQCCHTISQNVQRPTKWTSLSFRNCFMCFEASIGTWKSQKKWQSSPGRFSQIWSMMYNFFIFFLNLWLLTGTKYSNLPICPFDVTIETPRNHFQLFQKTFTLAFYQKYF